MKKISKWLPVVTRRPYLVAFIVCLMYLLLFQRNFVMSPDVWAEAFYEYVHGALVDGKGAFFDTGIAVTTTSCQNYLAIRMFCWDFRLI
jgi:hypothetical protein